MEGKFVVQCYDKKLSMMAFDQSHKHSIKFLKEDSGAKGLYCHGHQQEKEVIELSKPEVLRITGEFEGVLYKSNTKYGLEHLDSSAAEPNKFLKHLTAMCDLVSEGKVVNPFRETCWLGLMTLDTGEVMDPLTALSKHRQNQVF